MSVKAIPFDPFQPGSDYGVRTVTRALLTSGTKPTRQAQNWLKGLLEAELDALELGDGIPELLALRVRSVHGRAYMTFSSALVGSGRISSGLDVLTGRAVFQVSGSSLAAPLAASILHGVRGAGLLDMKRPMRVVTRPMSAAAAFDTTLYRPERLMTFRPRGYGRTDVSRHARVDLMTCWVSGESLRGLVRSVVTGVEVAREALARSAAPAIVHAYADDVVRPGS
ncbi:hypothetical protein AB0G49_14205 [Streptomyces longwoodensis]|uniref:hypothetical protein n=1 Tax=Streptomyces longwoodensis TaxID=68231 RepID=UPI0033FD9088